MVVGSTIIGILGNVWFNTLHPSVVVSYESVIMVGCRNLSKSWNTYDPILWLSNMKMTATVMTILMQNDMHCGHVPWRPPSVTIEGVGDTSWVRKAACDLLLFRIKWLGLNITELNDWMLRVSTGGVSLLKAPIQILLLLWLLILDFSDFGESVTKSCDSATNGKETGMKRDRLWIIAPVGRWIPNVITYICLNYYHCCCCCCCYLHW